MATKFGTKLLLVCQKCDFRSSSNINIRLVVVGIGVGSIGKTRIQNELNQTLKSYRPNEFKLKLNSSTS